MRDFVKILHVFPMCFPMVVSGLESPECISWLATKCVSFISYLFLKQEMRVRENGPAPRVLRVKLIQNTHKILSLLNFLI